MVEEFCGGGGCFESPLGQNRDKINTKVSIFPDSRNALEPFTYLMRVIFHQAHCWYHQGKCCSSSELCFGSAEEFIRQSPFQITEFFSQEEGC